jgi:hypothetical protein
MVDVLNGHLTSMFPRVRPCSEWSVEELQELQAELHTARNVGFDEIYRHNADNRKLNMLSLESYQNLWAEKAVHVKNNPHMKEMQRDGHCHEAVMWLVHHVASPDQHSIFAHKRMPLLSPVRHSCNGTLSASEAALCKTYAQQASCAECHSNSGIPYQDPDLSPVIPEDPKHPGWARQRRCDQNYQPACGPCEGIGGPYWGDDVSKFQPTSCELVKSPEDVPVAERIAPEFAEQFIVHQLGSDRLSRIQNAAQRGKFLFYSQIRSTLWYDFPVGGKSNGTAKDGVAKLRHDSYYDGKTYSWLDNGLVSELHFQTREQREANITGPMISLMHGLLGWGKNMGGCTCLADPVGVPVLGGLVDVDGKPYGAFMEGAVYKGRINIGVEYEGFKLGDKGHGDMTKKRVMLVDHYVKWFLHLFMDANKSSPTYGQPVRFYGPYSGFAVYVSVNKTQPPPEVWDTACVDNGWDTEEFKPLHKCTGKKISTYKCMNVEKTHPEVCKPYENGAGNSEVSNYKGSFGSIFVPEAAPEYV